MASARDSQIFQALGVALLIGAALGAAYYLADAQWAWLINVVLLAALCLLLGMWIMKLPLGILITQRNLMSLSRLQVVCWTLIIFSGLVVVVMQRLHHYVKDPSSITCAPPQQPQQPQPQQSPANTCDPLSITVDPKLWAVLGISFASFVGTPLILNGKTQDTPSANSVQAASLVLKEPATEIKQNAMGKVYVNPTPQDARISDMFEGDEIGNTAYVDVSKFQMFVLTALLLGIYSSRMWEFLAGDIKSLNKLPEFTASMVQLLAVSHAGYLTFKSVNHTDTTNQ